MKRTLILAALLAVGSAGFAPLPAMAQPYVSVVVGGPPPPPRFERVPAARRGHIWSQGHWEYHRGRHQWVPGVWIVDRPGYAYSAPVWYEDRGRWQMRPAAWSRGGHGHDRDRFDGPHRGGDRDRDGVPNRYDRDRDGDGVSNRHDRQPDNPRRN
jgi:hypothetical protein